MKLSTLLLSSADLVVAGSAYAADLPAKKGAPAAKAATGCPAFGAGYFQIPGGDTCIKLSGFVRSQFENDSSSLSHAATAEFNVTAISNTDLGALKAGFRQSMAATSGGATTGNNNADRAYISISGLTMGRYGAITDFAAYNGLGSSALGGGADSGTGVKYEMAAGPVNLTIAGQTNSSSTSGSLSSDIIGVVSGKAGMVSYSLAYVNHPINDGTSAANGTAVLGAVAVTNGPVTIGLFGSSAKGAEGYTNGSADDSDNTSSSHGGVSIAYNYGAGSAYAEYYANSGEGVSTTKWAEFGAKHTLTKGLTAQPAVGFAEGSDSYVGYLRITRDF